MDEYENLDLESLLLEIEKKIDCKFDRNFYISNYSKPFYYFEIPSVASFLFNTEHRLREIRIPTFIGRKRIEITGNEQYMKVTSMIDWKITQKYAAENLFQKQNEKEAIESVRKLLIKRLKNL